MSTKQKQKQVNATLATVIASLKAPVSAFLNASAKEAKAASALDAAMGVRRNTQVELGKAVAKITGDRDIATTALETLIVPAFPADRETYAKNLVSKVLALALGSKSAPGGLRNEKIAAAIDKAIKAGNSHPDKLRAVAIGNAKVNAKGEVIRTKTDNRGGSRSTTTPIENAETQLALFGTTAKVARFTPVQVINLIQKMLDESGFSKTVIVREA